MNQIRLYHLNFNDKNGSLPKGVIFWNYSIKIVNINCLHYLIIRQELRKSSESEQKHINYELFLWLKNYSGNPNKALLLLSSKAML